MKKKSQESCLAAVCCCQRCQTAICCLKVFIRTESKCFVYICLSNLSNCLLVSFSVSKKWFQLHNFQPCDSVNLKTLRPDAKFSRFQSKMFCFDLIEITTVGFSLRQRKVPSHVSIAGIFTIDLRWPTLKNVDIASQHCLLWLACQCQKHRQVTFSWWKCHP
jgi:hypothetical protein